MFLPLPVEQGTADR